MSFKLEDLIQESTASTGTADLALAGAASGYLAFSSYLSDGDTTIYSVIGSDGAKEVGVGTYVSATNTLQRTTVKSSTNGGAKIVLPTGTHTVVCGPDAGGMGLSYTAIQPASAEYNIGNLGSAYQIDLANGIKQRGTLNASCTLTAATPSGATTIRLRLVNSGVGNTITLSGIRWVGGEAPTLTTADAAENLIVLDYGNSGWIADGASL